MVTWGEVNHPTYVGIQSEPFASAQATADDIPAVRHPGSIGYLRHCYVLYNVHVGGKHLIPPPSSLLPYPLSWTLGTNGGGDERFPLLSQTLAHVDNRLVPVGERTPETSPSTGIASSVPPQRTSLFVLPSNPSADKNDGNPFRHVPTRSSSTTPYLP